LWRWLVIILAVVCLGLMPSVALASNPTVTITVSAWVVGSPSGLVITYISDTEIQLDWVKGADADNTMVRAKIGSEPASRTDGYLLYYGAGETATDTGVNLDEVATPVYYRLFSQNAAGQWEEEGILGFIEGIGVTTIAFIALALGIFGLAIWRRHLLLYAVAAIGCLVIGAHLTSTSLIFGVPIYLMSGYMFWEFVTWWF